MSKKEAEKLAKRAIRTKGEIDKLDEKLKDDKAELVRLAEKLKGDAKSWSYKDEAGEVTVTFPESVKYDDSKIEAMYKDKETKKLIERTVKLSIKSGIDEASLSAPARRKLKAARTVVPGTPRITVKAA